MSSQYVPGSRTDSFNIGSFNIDSFNIGSFNIVSLAPGEAGGLTSQAAAAYAAGFDRMQGGGKADGLIEPRVGPVASRLELKVARSQDHYLPLIGLILFNSFPSRIRA